jgi:hypothetical protein
VSDDEEQERLELAVDKVFMKLYGRTYRANEPPPAPIKTKSEPSTNGDSLGQIVRDFSSIFGEP